MPPTLIETPGADDANVYLSLDDALEYFDARPFSVTFTDASTDDQERALLYATRVLDGLPWLGTKGTTANLASEQALAWPRQWAPTREADAAPETIADYFTSDGILFYDADSVPRPIKDATCELALEILRAGTTDPFTVDATRNVRRERVDVLETEYFDPHDRAEGVARYPSVMRLIAPLLRTASALRVERV